MVAAIKNDYFSMAIRQKKIYDYSAYIRVIKENVTPLKNHL